MAHSPETRQDVRGHYVFERLPLEQAAERAGIPYNTARTWKKKAKERGDDWDRARDAARLTEGGLGDLTRLVLADFTAQFRATMDALKADPGNPLDAAQALTRMADSYVKMVGAAGRADPAITKHGIALEVLRLLSDYIRERFPQHLTAFAEVLEPFGGHLQRELRP